MTIQYAVARPQDRAELVALLKEANLPTDDLPANLDHFMVALNGDQLVGVAGLELFSNEALLRSVAVKPSYQGHQIANQLVDRLFEKAQSLGLQNLYLITTTADGYFARRGFTSVARANVPDAIRQTDQFSGLCPASAIVMQRTLPVLTHE
ncbi:GNAT family N-acetyltransferase [Rudanella paleaurantiibacter]|uniref:GNAT family N-acetyltransferase n=2 Tax=Rudanella paleaurantiibacter TaxID=2614655 RepID=A0A7J5TTV2_9BACT|nr:GNAT family N-acetyltransferase [Rudanella paleaurantiibacter]